MEGGGVAGYKSTARDLGAFICFEDEAGQGLSPPKGRTWAPRGARPVKTSLAPLDSAAPRMEPVSAGNSPGQRV